jgi:hypothetical protein
MRCAGYLVTAVLLASGGVAWADGEDAVQVMCKDGTMSTAGRGACEGRGGVAEDQGTAEPTKTTPASIESGATEKVPPKSNPVAQPAQVRCKDGVWVTVATGACSDRGGEDRTSLAPQAIPGAAPAPPARRESMAPNPKSTLTANPPLSDPDSARASARCKDGSFAQATHHSATCSGHGGVEEWLQGRSP